MKPSPPSHATLADLQAWMARAIMRPLTSKQRMQPRALNGESAREDIQRQILGNDRMSPVERLEIYNRQYWFRVLDSLREDFPGVRALLGEKKFARLAEAYLEACPSRSYTLRHLGARFLDYLKARPHWGGARQALLVDVARFEWAHMEAFDAAEERPLNQGDLRDIPPSKLRLGLQPYVQLLHLQYPIDDFLIALNQRETFRSAASNAVTARRASRSRALSLPKKQAVWIAIHRMNFRIYYKRLEPGAYALYAALSSGKTVLQASAAAAGSLSQASEAEKIQQWFHAGAQLGWFTAHRKRCRTSSK